MYVKSISNDEHNDESDFCALLPLSFSLVSYMTDPWTMGLILAMGSWSLCDWSFALLPLLLGKVCCLLGGSEEVSGEGRERVAQKYRCWFIFYLGLKSF